MTAPLLPRPRPPAHRRRATAPLAPLVLVAALVSCGAPAPPRAARLPDGTRGLAATVTHVVDGDTVDLDLGGATERARLLGIDTPETVKPDAPVDCFGPEASARTKVLVPPGTDVLVQRDREPRDRYGRLLLYVWRRSDGLFVNEALVRDGFARTLFIAPNTARRPALTAAAATARASGAGLWSTCPPDG